MTGAGWVKGSQAQLALQFYKDVTHKDFLEVADPTPPS